MKKARLSATLEMFAIAAFALLISAAPASAQSSDDCRCVDPDGNEIENCSCVGASPLRAWAFGFGAQADARPRIGISVDARQSARNDARGARVTALMEDGPAEEAGIRMGDVITSVDGHSLFEPLPGDAEDGFDLDGSIPVQRLLAITEQLETGQSVEIEYLRDGEAHAATVEAQELPSWGDDRWNGDFDFARPTLNSDRFRDQMRSLGDRLGSLEFRSNDSDARERMEELSGRIDQERRRSTLRVRPPRSDIRIFSGPDAPSVVVGDHLRGNLFTLGMGRIHGLELMEMKPGLASYFGTDEGLLVTDVDDESTLGLEPGDVILRIGDRNATSAGRVRRILSTYDEDEEITLHIMRDHDEITVTGRMGG